MTGADFTTIHDQPAPEGSPEDLLITTTTVAPTPGATAPATTAAPTTTTTAPAPAGYGTGSRRRASPAADRSPAQSGWGTMRM